MQLGGFAKTPPKKKRLLSRDRFFSGLKVEIFVLEENLKWTFEEM